MNKVLFPKKDYVKELVRFFKSSKNSQKLIAQLVQYLSIRIAWIISTKCFSCVMIFNE